MRSLSAVQSLSVAGEVLTIASLLEITLNDGTIVKLTDHDQNIGEWRSDYGLDLSAITAQLGGGGQAGTVSMLPDRGTGGGVSFDTIRAGSLDAARLRCYWTDFSADVIEPLLICTGIVTDVRFGDQDIIQISYTTPLGIDRPICGDTLSKTCRADFGDTRCGVELELMIAQPHVFAPADGMSFVMSRDENTPPGYYNNGTCYFTSGENKGLGYEILTVSLADENGRETLYVKVPLKFDVKLGDAITLYPGCDKYFTSGCAFWNNQANFQGEPFSVDTDNVFPPATALSSGSEGNRSDGDGVATGLPPAQNWLLTQYIRVGFGVNMTFQSGTRLTDVTPFNDTLIPYDAYTQIVNTLGGADVLFVDGGLRPVDQARQNQLVTAGYRLAVNVCQSAVYIDADSIDAEVEAMFYG